MSEKSGRRKRRLIWTLAIIVAVVVAIRLALPHVILHYANQSLATMEGYRGHIEDIDLAIIRGAYQIDSIYINKIDSVSNQETPFFAASLVDLSIEWPALLKGSIVGELEFRKPMLRFTRDKVEPDDVRKDSTTFKQLLDQFMPIKVNRFEVADGMIQYKDENSQPPVDVSLTETYILAHNLVNSYDSANVLLPATIEAEAHVYDGSLELMMKLNPMAEVPTFDMNIEVKNTNLVRLNDFFKAYAKADVSKGTFGMYSEIAAKDGKFKGYVKPFLKDLKVLGAEDKKDNALKKLWEGLVGSLGEVFENQPTDRFATKVPLEGKVENPDANVWYAVAQIIENAFIRALQPSLDQEINIATVETADPEKENLLQKVFGKADDEKKQARKDRREKKKKERKSRRAERKGDDKS